MSRIVNPDSAGKERLRCVKTIVLATRELLRQKEIGVVSRDLIACILNQLDRIEPTIDQTTAAWERRDYWIKADHFRMEWMWAHLYAERLRPLVAEENYAEIIPICVEIAQNLAHVKLSENHRMGEPWNGCWESLQNK